MMALNPRLARSSTCLLALLVAAGAYVTPTHATTVRRMSVPDMLERADDVARVRVVENRVRTDPDTLYHWTVTTFQVLDAVKGPLRVGDLLDVEVIGGEAPGSGYATVIADAPRFTMDEEVVLFSYNTRDGRRQPVGFYQGAVRLHPGEDGFIAVIPQANVTHQAMDAGVTAPAPIYRKGEPAPAADPTVGRGRAGAPEQPTAFGIDRRRMPADDFMNALHGAAAAAREERP